MRPNSSTLSKHQRPLLLFAGFCLFLAIYTVYSVRTSYLQEQRKVEASIANTSFLVGEWLRGAFIAGDYVLKDIITEVPPSQLVYPPKDANLHHKWAVYLETKRASLPNTVLLGLFNNKCIATHTNSVIGFDASEREYCRIFQSDTTNQTYISQAYVANQGSLNITQTRKFTASAGSTPGFAALAVDLKFFSRWLEGVDIGRHGVIAITDRRLTLLAQKPESQIRLGHPIKSDTLEAFIQGKSEYISYQDSAYPDMHARLFGAYKVKGMPFVVIVGEAETDWLANWRKQAWFIGTMLVIGTMLAIMTLVYHWRLCDQKEQLANLATRDALTGLGNRALLDSTLRHESARADRTGQSLGLIMIDIDHFKRVNDAYGHLTGDRVLQDLAGILIDNSRASDTVGRWGGEEFLILCPDTDLDGLRVLAESLRHQINSFAFPEVSQITASFGITSRKWEEPPHKAIGRADTALYRAKHEGRNRVSAL